MTTFITGGAGYLGRAILAETDDCIVYSRDEHKQWQLKPLYPDVKWILGDVRSLTHLTTVIPRGIDLVIHAAAQKFVPEGETAAIEFAQTNVEGTINVGLAAATNGAQCAILISTDKAVEPVNTYGATKMLAERIWLEFAERFPKTRFVVVRYGNVIGSTGSVVELFRKQARVQVTDLDATRFWMPVALAVEAIKYASRNVWRGNIYIPHIYGASLQTLIDAMEITEYDVLGLRPGEKRHESLVSYQEYPRCLSSATGITIHRTVQGECKYPFAIASNAVRQLGVDELRAMLPPVEGRMFQNPLPIADPVACYALSPSGAGRCILLPDHEDAHYSKYADITWAKLP